jgi:hypothetical protein
MTNETKKIWIEDPLEDWEREMISKYGAHIENQYVMLSNGKYFESKEEWELYKRGESVSDNCITQVKDGWGID